MDIKWIFYQIWHFWFCFGGHDDIAVILWRDVCSLVSIFRAEVKSSMPRFRPLRSSLGPKDPRGAMIHCDICICKFPWINFCRILPPWAFTERILGLHRAPCQEWHAVPELPRARGGHCQYVPTFFVLKPLDRYQSNSRHMCMLFHFRHSWRPEKHEINLVPYSKSKRVQIWLWINTY